MQIAPSHPHENERLSLLRVLQLLDTRSEEVFDRVTRLASCVLATPITLISLVDEHRQWFKSKVGLAAEETHRDLAFCAHAILGDELFIVEDSLNDPRFSDNPLVVNDPNIRFYAGMPIHTIGGLPLGTLCAIDRVPRQLTSSQRQALIDLAAIVAEEIHQRELLIATSQEIQTSQRLIEESKARYRAAFDQTQIGVVIMDQAGMWTDVNEAFCVMSGYSKQALPPRFLNVLIHPDDRKNGDAQFEQLTAGKIHEYVAERRITHQQGHYIWVSVHLSKYAHPDGSLDGYVATIKDIDAQKQAEERLQLLRRDLNSRVKAQTQLLSQENASLYKHVSQQVQVEKQLRKREAELRIVLENANEAYISMDENGVVTDWNMAAQLTFGWLREEATGKLLEDLIIPPELRQAHRAGLQRYLHSGEAYVFDKRLELSALHKEGRVFPVEVRINALNMGDSRFFSAFLHDISERKEEEAKQQWDLLHDPLTGLMNRRALTQHLPKALKSSREEGSELVLLFIDLDGFKQVNDTHGHAEGDALLKEVAARIGKQIRATDIVSRLSGDEFIVLLEHQPPGSRESNRIAQNIIDQLYVPVALENAEVQISCSIGIASSLDEGFAVQISAHALLKHADQAMYQAKHLGKNRYQCYVKESMDFLSKPEE